MSYADHGCRKSEPWREAALKRTPHVRVRTTDLATRSWVWYLGCLAHNRFKSPRYISKEPSINLSHLTDKLRHKRIRQPNGLCKPGMLCHLAIFWGKGRGETYLFLVTGCIGFGHYLFSLYSSAVPTFVDFGTPFVSWSREYPLLCHKSTSIT